MAKAGIKQIAKSIILGKSSFLGAGDISPPDIYIISFCTHIANAKITHCSIGGPGRDIGKSPTWRGFGAGLGDISRGPLLYIYISRGPDIGGRGPDTRPDRAGGYIAKSPSWRGFGPDIGARSGPGIYRGAGGYRAGGRDIGPRSYRGIYRGAGDIGPGAGPGDIARLGLVFAKKKIGWKWVKTQPA
jgi:hypothetical protein